MPQISKITLPSGTTYDIKDAEARSQIAALTGGDAIVFVGVSSTPMTDGGNEAPTVDGSTVEPQTGQLFFYGTEEFIWGADDKWHALGSLDSLGALAYKDTAETDYTPAGTVSQPTFTGSSSNVSFTIADNTSGNYTPKGTITGGTFTGSSTTFTGTYTPAGSVTTTVQASEPIQVQVASSSGATTYTPAGTVSTPTISVKTAGSTTIVKNPAKQTVAKTVVAVAPGTTAPANSLTYYSVANETLSLYQLGYTTGDSITTTDVTVKTGDAVYESTQPSFTGTGAHLETHTIDIPSAFKSTFTGTQASISTSGTPNGSNSALGFTGTKAQFTATVTPNGIVSQPTFTGTQATIEVS